MAEKIACLGWGSLIWDSGSLQMEGEWHRDGPEVRVEFVRKSGNGLLTLVLFDRAEPVRSHWVWIDAVDLDSAVRNLAEREGRGRKFSLLNIGRWPERGADPRILDLASWAGRQGADHVIWTALPPKFTDGESGKDQNGKWPSEDEAVEYLTNLPDDIRAAAQEYVRRAPVDTAYRRCIFRELGWAAGEPPAAAGG